MLREMTEPSREKFSAMELLQLTQYPSWETMALMPYQSRVDDPNLGYNERSLH